MIPSQSDFHVFGKFQGVVRRIAAVIGECPGGIRIAVIISLKGKLEPFFLIWGCTAGFLQAISEGFHSYADGIIRIRDAVWGIGIPGVEGTFRGLHDVRYGTCTFLLHDGQDDLGKSRNGIFVTVLKDLLLILQDRIREIYRPAFSGAGEQMGAKRRKKQEKPQGIKPLSYGEFS